MYLICTLDLSLSLSLWHCWLNSVEAIGSSNRQNLENINDWITESLNVQKGLKRCWPMAMAHLIIKALLSTKVTRKHYFSNSKNIFWICFTAFFEGWVLTMLLRWDEFSEWLEAWHISIFGSPPKSPLNAAFSNITMFPHNSLMFSSEQKLTPKISIIFVFLGNCCAISNFKWV